MTTSADSVRVAHPLFQAEGGGSKPTSALDLHVAQIQPKLAARLNQQWHSVLPVMRNYHIKTTAYGAVFGGLLYAVAIWSYPVSRNLNFSGMYELRRFAISPDAPRNTGSRMLRIMGLLVQRSRPDVSCLISYQDTERHEGTIYKAAGWVPSMKSDGGEWNSSSKIREPGQATGAKIRWEKRL